MLEKYFYILLRVTEKGKRKERSSFCGCGVPASAFMADVCRYNFRRIRAEPVFFKFRRQRAISFPGSANVESLSVSEIL